MPTAPSAILFSEMTPPDGRVDEFNRWYDHEHIPVRMAIPGFLGAARYRDGTTQNYLAVYEMTSIDVLHTAEYQRIKNNPSELTRDMLASVGNFTRYTGELLSSCGKAGEQAVLESPVLYAVFFAVPADRLQDFDAWNEEEHVPLLMDEPDWLGVRRFTIIDGSPRPFNRLALHHLADRRALNSEARHRARATEWRAKLATESWFRGHYVVFDALGPRFRSQR